MTRGLPAAANAARAWGPRDGLGDFRSGAARRYRSSGPVFRSRCRLPRRGVLSDKYGPAGGCAGDRRGPPTPESPWLVQPFVEGETVCTYRTVQVGGDRRRHELGWRAHRRHVKRRRYAAHRPAPASKSRSEPLSATVYSYASVSRDTRHPRAVTDQIRPARRCEWRAQASHPHRPPHSGSPQASQWPAHQACFESRVQIAVPRFSTERRAAGSWRSARIRPPARRQRRRLRCSLRARQPLAPRRTRRKQGNSQSGMRAARTRQTSFDDLFCHERLDSQRTRIPVYGHASTRHARLDAAARDAKQARLVGSQNTRVRRAREDRTADQRLFVSRSNGDT
jgi:hypothetical protein